MLAPLLRPTRPLQFEPVTGTALVAFVVAKKAGFFILGRQYGWSRLYRRLREAHKQLPPNPTVVVDDGTLVRHGLQEVLRSPHKVVNIFASNPSVMHFLEQVGLVRKG